MPKILCSHPLPDNHRLLVVAAASSGGGKWCHPVVIRLVETQGGPYTQVGAPNVVRVIGTRGADGRYTGPRSGYHATVTELRQRMMAEASNHGEVPPIGVPPVTIPMTRESEATEATPPAHQDAEVAP